MGLGHRNFLAAMGCGRAGTKIRYVHSSLGSMKKNPHAQLYMHYIDHRSLNLKVFGRQRISPSFKIMSTITPNIGLSSTSFLILTTKPIFNSIQLNFWRITSERTLFFLLLISSHSSFFWILGNDFWIIGLVVLCFKVFYCLAFDNQLLSSSGLTYN